MDAWFDGYLYSFLFAWLDGCLDRQLDGCALIPIGFRKKVACEAADTYEDT